MHIVAELWHCTPAQVLAQPYEHYTDALLFHGARNQGRADATENERAEREARAGMNR